MNRNKINVLSDRLFGLFIGKSAGKRGNPFRKSVSEAEELFQLKISWIIHFQILASELKAAV